MAFLGHVVSNDGIMVDLSKVATFLIGLDPFLLSRFTVSSSW